MRRWDALIEKFMKEYEARGVEENTRIQLRSELERWGNWNKRRKPKPSIEEIDSELITRYISARTRFKAKATVYSVISRMRLFGNFIVRESIWIRNPLKWMRGPRLLAGRRVPKRLDKNRLRTLLELACTRRTHYYRYLWVTALLVLYSAGFRRGELERLNIEDWNSAERSLRVRNTKTGLEHAVPIPEATANCIEAYLPKRNVQLEKQGFVGEKAFFVNKNGSRMSAGSLSQGVHKMLREADMPIASLHQFRHSCASDLMEAGVKIPMIQKMLGHKRIETTMRYVSIADPQRKEAMDLHPINTMLASVAPQV